MTTPIYLVIAAIIREREYQDAKWGTIENHQHTLPEWTEIMQDLLTPARLAAATGNDQLALFGLLQLVAVGVACLEQHGVVERPTQEAPNA